MACRAWPLGAGWGARLAPGGLSLRLRGEEGGRGFAVCRGGWWWGCALLFGGPGFSASPIRLPSRALWEVGSRAGGGGLGPSALNLLLLGPGVFAFPGFSPSCGSWEVGSGSPLLCCAGAGAEEEEEEDPSVPGCWSGLSTGACSKLCRCRNSSPLCCAGVNQPRSCCRKVRLEASKRVSLSPGVILPHMVCLAFHPERENVDSRDSRSSSPGFQLPWRRLWQGFHHPEGAGRF